jgi:hypothetical protein
MSSKIRFTLFPIHECYYVIPNHLLLLLGVDVETNPGPTCIWLRNHPLIISKEAVYILIQIQ